MILHLSDWKRRAQHLIMVAAAILIPLTGFGALPTPARAFTFVQTANISIDGILLSIDGEVWNVSGVSVHVTATTVITGAAVIGSTVHVAAFSDGHNQIIAQSVTVLQVTVVVVTATPGSSVTPSATFTPSLTPTPSLTDTAGPSPTPTVTNTPGTITPTVTPAASPTGIPYVAIIIEGPVESITVNVIVVYGERIKLRGDDPVLVKLKVGDWVRLSGNYGLDDDQITVVVIAVVVVVIDTPTVIVVGPSGNGDGEGDDQGNNGNGNNGNGHKDKH